MTIRVERLDPGRHERSGFDSGNDVLDQWLREYAHQNDARANTGRTWVAVDDQARAGARGRVPIVGYVTVAAHGLSMEHARTAVAKGSLPDPVPAALIARLAVDRRHQQHGLGGRLLQFAIARVVLADEALAVTLVVVDAIDDAASAFYAHHGFLEIPGARRLVARTSDLRAAFG